MTTREVAQALGCKPQTITDNAKKCLPNKKIENGKPTFWTEEEVTVLLEFIKGNNNNQTNLTRSALGSETSLTPIYKLQQSAKDIVANLSDIQTADFLAFTRTITDAYIAKLQAEKSSLAITLDKAKEYASVKRMEKLNPERKFNWRVLKAKAEELGSEIKKVFDQNYGEVNSYHKSVWESCYELDEFPWD